MILELLFNEPIYRKQMELLYEMGFGKKRTYYKNSHYLGFVLLLIGFLLSNENGNRGYFLILFGLGILIPYYIFNFKNKKLLLKLEKEQKEIISFFKENPSVVFEFNDKGLKYRDYSGSVNFDWGDFLTFIEKEENIFLFTKNYQPFILGKSEIGNENYNQIVSFLKTKFLS